MGSCQGGAKIITIIFYLSGSFRRCQAVCSSHLNTALAGQLCMSMDNVVQMCSSSHCIIYTTEINLSIVSVCIWVWVIIVSCQLSQMLERQHPSPDRTWQKFGIIVEMRHWLPSSPHPNPPHKKTPHWLTWLHVTNPVDTPADVQLLSPY